MFWIEFFLDKRFDWDFKIANFIMGDSLRNYLTTNCAKLQSIAESGSCTRLHAKRINDVIANLHRLMKNE